MPYLSSLSSGQFVPLTLSHPWTWDAGSRTLNIPWYLESWYKIIPWFLEIAGQPGSRSANRLHIFCKRWDQCLCGYGTCCGRASLSEMPWENGNPPQAAITGIHKRSHPHPLRWAWQSVLQALLFPRLLLSTGTSSLFQIGSRVAVFYMGIIVEVALARRR